MACSVKGVGAARNWYPRPSWPSPHDLISFLRYGEGQRAAQLPAGRSFDTAKGKERPLRGSRCRFIKMINHARPWALVARPCGAHPCFRNCTPSRGSSAMCQPAGSAKDDLRLVVVERSESAIGWCSANRCSAATDAVWSAPVWGCSSVVAEDLN
jgi:hypothetical protein